MMILKSRKCSVMSVCYSLEILEQFRVPDAPEIMRPNAISFVLLAVTLVAVKAPIGPVQIQLLDVFDEILPRGAPVVLSELAQQERHSLPPCDSSNVQLLVEQLLSEPLLAHRIPKHRSPGKPVEMPTVDQLMRNLELQRVLQHCPEIQLVVHASHNDQHAWCLLVDPITCSLSGLPPVEIGPVAPGGPAHVGRPDFVAQVDADDPGVLVELVGQGLQTAEKLLFRVVVVEPEAVSVVVAAAPLGFAGVVVENHH